MLTGEVGHHRASRSLDGVVGKVEEPEADNVDGGGVPAGAGERAAVLLGVTHAPPDVRREPDNNHLALPEHQHPSSSVKNKQTRRNLYCQYAVKYRKQRNRNAKV